MTCLFARDRIAPMPSPAPLEVGKSYHIYNRGNNGENLFRQTPDYRNFLRLYRKHLEPICETFAYCLMPNHFHLLIRVRDKMRADSNGQPIHRPPGQALANLFVAYTKTMNNMLERTGSLFEHPFHRKSVEDDAYFNRLVVYIHLNPQRHEFVDDFHLWPWSSYLTLLGQGSTLLERDAVLDRFGGPENFAAAHRAVVDETLAADDF